LLNELEIALCNAVDESFEREQIPWFAQLVEQPSFTTAREDVEAAATLIDAKTAEIGLRQELVPDPRTVYADHRVYSTPAVRQQDVALALVGHCDTVYPRAMGFLHFQRDAATAASGGDYVRGPGVLDMKSGLSVIVFGLQAVSRVMPDVFSQTKIRFFCNTDEEVGSPSSLPMFERMAPFTTAAMVFEGGRDEDRVITARKGVGAFTLTVTGRPAHAGNDHATGVNAIHALALLIPRVEALTDYSRGTTANVGTVTGGNSKNTVPGEATCVIDVRVTSAAEGKRIESSLKRISENPFAGIDDLPDRLRQVQVVLGGALRRPPMEPTPQSQLLRAQYEQFAGKVGLGVGEAPLQGGGSDGNSLAACGVPTIDGLGPYGKAFHSPDEWSSLVSLKRRTQALACFLANHASS
jgi:glutamate carboxypeptidase